MPLTQTQVLAMVCCDDFFDAMLRRFVHGSIHSVFSNAVNLLVGKDIYTVAAGNAYPAPYTANTEPAVDFKRLPLTQGAAIAADACRLYLSPSAVLDLTKRTTFSLPSHRFVFQPDILRKALQRFDHYVREHRVNRGCMRYYLRRYLGIPLETECIGEMVDRRIDRWLANLPRGTHGFAALHKLIGAGSGLTPAGDDFFCGFFAALDGTEHAKAASIAAELRQYLLPRLGQLQTTDISRQMLKAQLAGLLPQPYNQLKQAFLHQPCNLPPAMMQMEAIGHSSGVDFAAGMACALHFILENCKIGETNVQQCNHQKKHLL